jgi:hypothetical protein
MCASIGMCLFILVLSCTELNTSYIMKIDASWHKFKNFVAVEIMPLHLQAFTFTNSYSHFIIMEFMNSQVLPHRRKQLEV